MRRLKRWTDFQPPSVCAALQCLNGLALIGRVGGYQRHDAALDQAGTAAAAVPIAKHMGIISAGTSAAAHAAVPPLATFPHPPMAPNRNPSSSLALLWSCPWCVPPPTAPSQCRTVNPAATADPTPNAFASPSALAAHWHRVHQSRGAHPEASCQQIAATLTDTLTPQTVKSAPTSRFIRRRHSDHLHLLSQPPPHLPGSTSTTAASATMPSVVPPDPDAMAEACALYAHFMVAAHRSSCGEPWTALPERDDQFAVVSINDSSRAKSNETSRGATMVLVDAANRPQIFHLLAGLDPGAVATLRRSVFFVCVVEPRVALIDFLGGGGRRRVGKFRAALRLRERVHASHPYHRALALVCGGACTTNATTDPNNPPTRSPITPAAALNLHQQQPLQKRLPKHALYVSDTGVSYSDSLPSINIKQRNIFKCAKAKSKRSGRTSTKRKKTPRATSPPPACNDFVAALQRHGRLFVHRCHRLPEAGDLMMMDIASRVRAELEGAWAADSACLGPRVATPHHVAVEGGDGAVIVTADVPSVATEAACPEWQGHNRQTMSDDAGAGPDGVAEPSVELLRALPPRQVRFRERAQIHLVTNDLRHRCNVQRVFGRDCIVGHHSFECTDTHFESCLRALLLDGKWC